MFGYTVVRSQLRADSLAQDESMVSAVTLEGWKNRPQCFKFVERKFRLPALASAFAHLILSLQLAPEVRLCTRC